MPCKLCSDPAGMGCFPLYGLGPHSHPTPTSTLLEEQTAYPGFTPNPDEPGMGWHWCPRCGDGHPSLSEADLLGIQMRALDAFGTGSAEGELWDQLLAAETARTIQAVAKGGA